MHGPDDVIQSLFALAVLTAATVAATIALWVAARNRAWLARLEPCPARTRAGERTRMLAARIVALAAIAALAATGGADAMVSGLGAEAAIVLAALSRPAVDLALSTWAAPRSHRSDHLFQRLRGSAPALAALLPVIMAVGWAAEAAGGLWWLAAGLGWLAVVAWGELRSRSPVPPTPLPPGPASRRFKAMAAAAGLPHIPILSAASPTPQANARAEGILAWRRVVLDDTLLERLPEAEAAAVVAHELGHLAGRHRELFAFWRLCAGVAMLAVAGVAAGGGMATLCLVITAAPVFRFLIAPAENAMIGRLEFAADGMAANLAGASSMASALRRLADLNHSLPAQDALHSAFHSPHPGLPSRLARLGAG